MIYGEQVRLRALERSDVPQYYEWVNDPEVIAGLKLFLPSSTHDEEKWFENAMKGPQEEKPLVIEVRDGKGWRMIGNCGFLEVDWVARSAEFGIMIGDKGIWNLGLGTEATLLILRHGFHTLNMNRIGLKVYADNKGAIRAYEKAGFVHEGCMRQAVYRNGEYKDVLFMSVLREEWSAQIEED
jgi:RimJ/RimL family protein N-acetyltransferase